MVGSYLIDEEIETRGFDVPESLREKTSVTSTHTSLLISSGYNLFVIIHTNMSLVFTIILYLFEKGAYTFEGVG